MRSQRLIICLLVPGLLACRVPPTAPAAARIPPGDLIGRWSVQLTDTAGCGDSSSTATIRLYVVLESDIPDQTLFHFVNEATSTWSRGQAVGPLGGFFSFEYDDLALFNFFSGLPGASSLANAQLAGVLDAHLTIRGTLRDSVANGTPPLFGSQPCRYRAVAKHEGA